MLPGKFWKTLGKVLLELCSGRFKLHTRGYRKISGRVGWEKRHGAG